MIKKQRIMAGCDKGSWGLTCSRSSDLFHFVQIDCVFPSLLSSWGTKIKIGETFTFIPSHDFMVWGLGTVKTLPLLTLRSNDFTSKTYGIIYVTTN
jgi:hypothetical protein